MATIYFGSWTTVAEVLEDPDYKSGNFAVCRHLPALDKLRPSHEVFAGMDYDYDSACDGEIYVCDSWLDVSCGCHAPDEAYDDGAYEF